MMALGGGAVFYEQGTPVAPAPHTRYAPKRAPTRVGGGDRIHPENACKLGQLGAQ